MRKLWSIMQTLYNRKSASLLIKEISLLYHKLKKDNQKINLTVETTFTNIKIFINSTLDSMDNT